MTEEITTSTLGWVYIALAAAWTAVFVGAIFYLRRHCRLPFLQLRRLPLMCTAVILLHLYAIVCLICYMIGPLVPCDAQFWIMSIYLPCGIALLQAANSQFLHVASQQRKYAKFANLDELELLAKSENVDPTLPWWKRTFGRVRRADGTARIVVYIGIAMAVELACVSLMAGHLVYSTNAATPFSVLPTYVSHSLRRETLDAIASWENKNRGSDFAVDAVSASTALVGSTLGVSAKSAKTKASAHSGDSRRSDMFTMLAMENALRNNPRPLLEFAALKDFSGENISFLSHVADWRRGWVSLTLDPPTLKYEQFIQAMRIYSHFISLECSQFPINISSRLGKELRETFDSAANMLNRREGTQLASATPFDSSGSSTELWKTSDLEGTLGEANLQSVMRMADLTGDGRPDVPIPDSFSQTVFDAAEGEIKYLVLTNTWPKFVHSGLESAGQAADGDEKYLLDGIRKYLCGVERLPKRQELPYLSVCVERTGAPMSGDELRGQAQAEDDATETTGLWHLVHRGNYLPGLFIIVYGSCCVLPQRGVITYSMSPNRQNPLAGAGRAAVSNTWRRFSTQVLYWAPPLVAAYYAMKWADEGNKYLNSKAGRAQRGDSE
ncbi:hypothetical protein DL767_001986 [Monosporascus sp. MG133]|nr:hypothetical protein DL767_001986 [Monosporascus sp. MG133]